MAWFKCDIHGENFPGDLIREAGLVGFYVTRFVEASSSDIAEDAAMVTLRGEPKLAPSSSYIPSGKTRVNINRISEVPADEVPQHQPGFCWYREEAGQ